MMLYNLWSLCDFAKTLCAFVVKFFISHKGTQRNFMKILEELG
jgi:hypothetical protein